MENLKASLSNSSKKLIYKTPFNIHKDTDDSTEYFLNKSDEISMWKCCGIVWIKCKY